MKQFTPSSFPIPTCTLSAWACLICSLSGFCYYHAWASGPLSSTAAPQFSHIASAGGARVSPSGISGVFSGFVAYLVVITHAHVVFLMIWRQESRKECVSLQSLCLTEDIRTCSNKAKDYKLSMLFLLVDRTKLSQMHLPWLLL